MKAIKMFSLDMEVANRLSNEKNASSLVNQLVSDYYKGLDDPYEKMSVEQLQLEQKKIAIIREAQEKIEGLSNDNGSPEQ